MTLTFQYPVVYFYGDDEEDSEIIQKEGRIEPLKTDKEPYEAIVSVFFASLFWTKLQNIFGHCCMSKLDKIAKCWSALLSRPTIALQTLFNCYSTRYGNGRSVSVSSCACSLK